MSARMPVLLSGSGFSPKSIQGLGFWLDATDRNTLFQDSAGTTPVTADADPVGKWVNKSGTGTSVIQATAGSRPLYKTAQQNGKPGVRFDGVDDALRVASINLTIKTWVFCLKRISNTGNVSGISTLVNKSSDGLNCRTNNDTTYRADGVSADAADLVFSGGTIRINGTAGFTFSLGTAHVASFRNAGGAAVYDNISFGRRDGTNDRLWNGEFYEVIGYDTSLSDANVALVEAYLKAKWGTP